MHIIRWSILLEPIPGGRMRAVAVAAPVVRACLKRSRSQATKHDTGHRQVDQRFAMARLDLIILHQSPMEGEPAEGALDHPAMRKDRKSLLAGQLLDRCYNNPKDGMRPMQERPVIG